MAASRMLAPRMGCGRGAGADTRRESNHPIMRLRIASAVATCAFLLAPIASGASQPNVVFVITDDQGYGDLSCHGNEVIETPELDKLHGESVRLTDYHVSPTCAPTRGALMSGHFTNRAGPWHTIMGRSFLFEGEKTFGEVFSASGYLNGYFVCEDGKKIGSYYADIKKF